MTLTLQSYCSLLSWKVGNMFQEAKVRNVKGVSLFHNWAADAMAERARLGFLCPHLELMTGALLGARTAGGRGWARTVLS